MKWGFILNKPHAPSRLHDEDWKTAIEEMQQHASAFHANIKGAAGWRMMAYLLKTGNIATTVTGEYRDRENEATQSRTTLEFLMVTNARLSLIQRALAATALTQMHAFYSLHRSLLESQIEEKSMRFTRIMERLFGVKNEVSEAHEHLETTARTASELNETMVRLRERAHETQQSVFNASLQTAALENRSIKIVRPLQTIAELRASLTQPETQAPAIYIVAGEENGVLLYDRISMTETGRIAVEKVQEHDAPDLFKEQGIMFTDMVERVYHRPDGKGGTELVRMEHGLNGSLMGPIGDISRAMIGRYMAVTGRQADELTTDAASYEARMQAQLRLIEESHAACKAESAHTVKYYEAQDILAQAREAFSARRSELVALQKNLDHCCSELRSLKRELRQTDRIIAHIASARDRLESHELSGIDGVMAALPRGLESEFMNFYNAAEGAKDAANGIKLPDFAHAWASAAPLSAANRPAPETGAAHQLAFNN